MSRPATSERWRRPQVVCMGVEFGSNLRPVSPAWTFARQRASLTKTRRSRESCENKKSPKPSKTRRMPRISRGHRPILNQLDGQFSRTSGGHRWNPQKQLFTHKPISGNLQDAPGGRACRTRLRTRPWTRLQGAPGDAPVKHACKARLVDVQSGNATSGRYIWKTPAFRPRLSISTGYKETRIFLTQSCPLPTSQRPQTCSFLPTLRPQANIRKPAVSGPTLHPQANMRKPAVS